MNNIITKLQSKRGVSIMLALLLFLICVLAGTAALTAAHANVGRHNYMRESQQQYLAVSSAAKLIREQLDGMEIRTRYTLTADEYDGWNDPAIYPGGDFSIRNASVDNSGFDYYLDGTIEPNTNGTILQFFSGDTGLETMIQNAFYNAVKSNPGGVPWATYTDEGSISHIVDEFDFDIICDEIKDEDEDDKKMKVNVHVKIENAKTDYDGEKDVKITVTAKNYDYFIEMNGKIEINVPAPEIIRRRTEERELDPTLFPGFKTIFDVIEECGQTSDTTVKFTVEDSFTRKAETAGGGDTP